MSLITRRGDPGLVTGADFGTVDEAVRAIGAGELVVVLDDEDRENEGDLIMAAELITPADVAFMVRHTSGLICVGMTGERLDQLDLPLMVAQSTESMGTAFTVSVDYRHGTTTGISAGDRARTIRALADPQSSASEFARPGRVLPLRARAGGVLTRAGHTEAAADLAGLVPAGVLCEIVNPDGTMARGPELARFAVEHGLVMIPVDQLVAYRRRREQLVRLRASASLPTPFGLFTMHAYESVLDGVEHVALVQGQIDSSLPTLVRIHPECLGGDVFGSASCDCGPQLLLAMRQIAEARCGVIVYLRGHKGRGVGIPIDSRECGVAAQILAQLGVGPIRLMTNNPAKFGGLAGYGLEIAERVPLILEPTPNNFDDLQTKRVRLGHLAC